MNIDIIIDCTNITGLLLGVVGSYVIVKFTYGFESFFGYGNTEIINQITQRNTNRLKYQRLGFKLLLLAFLLQFFAVALHLVCEIKITNTSLSTSAQEKDSTKL